MRKRYVYTLLFAVPALFVALLAAFVVVAMAAGFFWIFLFGDDAWPSVAETSLALLFVSVFLGIWLVATAIGYGVGRRLEQEPGHNMHHMLISAAATVVPLVIVIGYQYQVGNLGTVSDAAICSEYCAANGFAASGIPPRDSSQRYCTCYGDDGEEAQALPIIDITKP